MNKVLAVYDSESSPGQKLTVSFDGTNMVCDCLLYAEHMTCKHIMDYDLSGGACAEKVADDSHSTNPQPKPVTAVEDGIDAPDMEKKPIREFEEPEIEEAIKKASQTMKERE